MEVQDNRGEGSQDNLSADNHMVHSSPDMDNRVPGMDNRDKLEAGVVGRIHLRDAGILVDWYMEWVHHGMADQMVHMLLGFGDTAYLAGIGALGHMVQVPAVVKIQVQEVMPHMTVVPD
jgi:hypothetical protein